MENRYFSLWFSNLEADWTAIRQPELKGIAFALAAPERGRMVVRAVSSAASQQGIGPGMVVADARATFPALKILDYDPALQQHLLSRLARWCLRYTPVAAIDPPDGLMLDISGCAHLWGGERPYLKELVEKLRAAGFHVRGAIAGTIGTAWAVSRYGTVSPIVEQGLLLEALQPLPPAALRLGPPVRDRLTKLGLTTVGSFISMSRPTLRRRFGQQTLDRIDQATGSLKELLQPIVPIEPFQERLPALEPVRTRVGIEIALQNLLETMCSRLINEQKGLRKAMLKCFRIDGRSQMIEIATGRPSRNTKHLFHLFELKIGNIEPGLGIELFLLEAPLVEELSSDQNVLWQNIGGVGGEGLAELLDRITVRLGKEAIERFLPVEHHWPERCIRASQSLDERPATRWLTDNPRPVILLPQPVKIQVTAPIPDYPPMLFIYQGNIHKIKKADGPERLEPEWWLDEGLHRDYYLVEDEKGARYWLFRLGHYDEHNPEWFLHGFFA